MEARNLHDFRTDFGFELLSIRLKRGKTQENVRNELGIDISHFECGKRFPRIDTLLKICKYYQIPLCYLFARVEFPESLINTIQK